jgi:AcrR family transcriptional regulator
MASGRADTRKRIVRAAAGLLAEGGREAVTKRAVAAAAGVQAPTIYRLFGDMHGLLDEVATHGLTTYLNDTTDLKLGDDPVEDLRAGWYLHVGFGDDPVEDLRAGWDLQVGFGLANPALYKLMYGDPRPGTEPAAALEGAKILRELVRRVAEAGRLGISEERAAQMLHAAGSGVTLALIGVEPEERDPALSDMFREMVIAAITTDAPAPAAPGPLGAAVHMRAVLPQTSVLTDRERALLQEWLDRIAGC